MSNIFTQVVHPALQLGGKIADDNSIDRYDFVEFMPQNQNNLQNGGELRFEIPAGDQYIHASEGYLILSGQIVKTGGVAIGAPADETTAENVGAPVNNFWAYLFSDARYELANQQVERVFEFPTSNLMYRTITGSSDGDEYGLDSGWALEKDDPAVATLNIEAATPTVVPTTGNKGWQKRRQYMTRYLGTSPNRGRFSVLIPLKEIFGFCRDYTQVLYGMNHSIIFSRNDPASSSLNALQFAGATTISPSVKLEGASLWMPFVRPSIDQEDRIKTMVESRVEYPIAYRAHNVSKYTLGTDSSMTWNFTSLDVSTESPMYAIVGFQDETRLGNIESTPSVFDWLDVNDIAVYANGQRLPSAVRNYSGGLGKYKQAYREFERFRADFNGTDSKISSGISDYDFKKYHSLHVIDLNQMPQQLRTGTVNLQLRANFGGAVGANKSAYLLLITKKVLALRADGVRFQVIQK